MNLRLLLLGVEVLRITTQDDPELEHDEPGDCTTYPIGIGYTAGRQWEPAWDTGDDE